MQRKPKQVNGVLLVRERADGPVIFVKWRDSDQRQLMRRLGPGWLAPEGAAHAKPAGARIGRWVERRGRALAGTLDVRGAHDAMRSVIDARESELAAERRRAAAIVEPGVMFADAAAVWLQRGITEREWKPSTARDYGNTVDRLCRELGEREIADVTEDELRAMLAGLKPILNGHVLDRPASARMRTKYTVVARAIFALAEEERWIEVSPARRLKIVKPRRQSKNHPVRREQYLTPEEVHALVRAAEPQDGAFFLTLAFAGLRLGEGVALRWQDIDFARAALHVERNFTVGQFGTPKGGSGRTVPMADEIAQALARLEQRGYLVEPTDLVFVGRKGGVMDVNRVRLRYYDVQARAGIQPRRTLHQLRHTFATVCASHGIPLRTIQGWCGHEDYSTTERYAHLMPRHEDAALVSAAFGQTRPTNAESAHELVR